MDIPNIIETMNNKIHDGEDEFKGDNDTIFPVSLMRQEERSRLEAFSSFQSNLY